MIEQLTGKTRELADYMSELSEEAYEAGWMLGLEYVLWYAIHIGPKRYGRLEITNHHITTLKRLSSEIDGWIYFHSGEESYISLNDWISLYNKNIHDYKNKID